MFGGEESEQEPKPNARTNSDRIIIFHTSTKAVEVVKKADFSETRLILILAKLQDDEPREIAPKLGKWINVHAKSSSKELKGLVLTTLDLGMLGWADSCRRLFGRCNEIYVVD
ncbi:uncharacterized protein KY384_005031 [Bacidia gigantensis]|uniref:uncharacterized protein n=1 Tax=Bacidia gigantensis TaxID=2732470 RepID=UPI001D049F8F|nr:uncharacterized protein KY384_005031 [Bacidia gigantensis]KAG8530528.1 hypothetical protein KY384_005031 [Bacidia gigantensis]